MAAYHIKFIKTVSDENAHSETVIRSMVINLARDAVRAVAAAKRRFERLENVTHWRLRADRMKVVLAGQASRGMRDVGSARIGHWRSYLESRMNGVTSFDPEE